MSQPFSFNEPAYTAKIRDSFLDLAAILISSHGVNQVGLMRRGRPEDSEFLRLFLTIEGGNIQNALERLMSFGAETFRLASVDPKGVATVRKIQITAAFTNRPLATEADGGLGQDGLRATTDVHVDWPADQGRNPSIDSVHRALKAWAYRAMLPKLDWLRSVATDSPPGYGLQLLVTPYQLKESVTFIKPMWWNE